MGILCLMVLPAALLLTAVQVAALRFVDPPFTAPMVWHRLSTLVSGAPYQRPLYVWRDLEAISPSLRKAVQAAEDQRFLDHFGFDFVEMAKSLEDYAEGERLRGASTITMQTARSVFLWNGRSYVRKALEGWYTLLLELMLSKRRILEVYLNTVDWGDDVYGAQGAARTYFHTDADNLSAYRAALLAAVLPNPHKWSPARPTRYLRGRLQRILRDMPSMPAF